MLRLLIALCVTCLSACSWLPEQEYVRNRSDDYRKARVEPRIKVPSYLQDDALQDIYVIPATTETVTPSGSFEVPRPAPLVAQESEELVRIQRLGGEEWMLAALAPGQLWPQVRSFLTTNGVQVARVDARAGLMETGWFQGRDASMAERYQFRIEQGVQRNTAELHVLQQYQAGDINRWPEASADAERSSEMLLAVAQYLANSAETAPVSMMAQQAMGEGGKVTLQEDADGDPFVRLSLPYYRAWASLDRALRESGFTIRDLDRSAGLFYVRFVPPEEDKGWFGWLFGGSDDDEDLLTQQDYVIKVSEETSDQVRIDLAREDGAVITSGQKQQLLGLLKGNIN